jgi:lipid A ethanolaminephosphotransferase
MNVSVALYVLALCNSTFWSRAAPVFDGHVFKLLAFGGAFGALTLIVISVLGFRWFHKPVLVFITLLSSVTSYYQDELGATIDRDMIQNVMQTTFNEAHHLVTAQFVTHVALFGVLPAVAILWVKVRRRGIWRDTAAWAGMATLSVALFLSLLYSDFKSYSAVIRERKDIVEASQPFAPIKGMLRYAKLQMKNANLVVEPLGADAVKGERLAGLEKPMLTVVFAGETARAMNFGVNGYPRDTTPETAAPEREILNFSQVESCGTATAVSLPCMFSKLTQAEYSDTKAKSQENLLDVLVHAGVKVEWYDANTGDQSIAKRIGWSPITADMYPASCEAGECTDGAFLTLLQSKIDTITEDTVLVFHMIGSHGPAYFMRYPESYRKFTPDCRTPEFAKCTNEEIRNAYDNTIAFTDHILASSVDILSAAQNRVTPALFYVSDHGESLGENGLYLHGAPRFMAPEQQYKVPMMMWFSKSYRAQMGLDQTCVAHKHQDALSQDNMFSTLLGIVDIKSDVYDRRLDILAGCIGQTVAKVQP